MCGLRVASLRMLAGDFLMRAASCSTVRSGSIEAPKGAATWLCRGELVSRVNQNLHRSRLGCIHASGRTKSRSHCATERHATTVVKFRAFRKGCPVEMRVQAGGRVPQICHTDTAKTCTSKQINASHCKA